MLDEPFNGMDPEGIVWMRGFLRALAAEGRAVLVSSHLMSELQALLTEEGADRLIIAGRGRVIADHRGRARRVGRGPGHAARAGGGLPDPHQRRDRVPRGQPGAGAMTAGTVAPPASGRETAPDAITQLLRAEWTKFRSVRAWVTAMIAAVLVTVGLGVLIVSGSVCSVGPFPGHPRADACSAPLGPGGVAVTDSFCFVHQPLTGNGSLTVRMTALTGVVLNSGAPGLQPWSKAGIIVKAGTRPGFAYAAMLVTGGHGVRMQYDYTHDEAGPPGAVSAASPRWLRLVRSGDTLTGFASADGTRWTRVAAATLPGLPATVQAGLFATSPPVTQESQSGSASSGTSGPPGPPPRSATSA
jgi:hypothetical protein